MLFLGWFRRRWFWSWGGRWGGWCRGYRGWYVFYNKKEICDFRAISLLLSLVKRTSLMFVGNIAYTIFIWGQSWSHGRCEFESCWWRGVLHTTICDKVCQWLVTGRWFSRGPPVSPTNKTDCHDIIEILLKVALNTINQTKRTIYHIYLTRSLNGILPIFSSPGRKVKLSSH